MINDVINIFYNIVFKFYIIMCMFYVFFKCDKILVVFKVDYWYFIYNIRMVFIRDMDLLI